MKEHCAEPRSVTRSNALLPFADESAAAKAGFNTDKAFPFEPFNPVLPNELGEFISFKGC
jgi:hypothetical protein